MLELGSLECRSDVNVTLTGSRRYDDRLSLRDRVGAGRTIRTTSVSALGFGRDLRYRMILGDRPRPQQAHQTRTAAKASPRREATMMSVEGGLRYSVSNGSGISMGGTALAEV